MVNNGNNKEAAKPTHVDTVNSRYVMASKGEAHYEAGFVTQVVKLKASIKEALKAL